MGDCLFCKIVSGEIPSKKVFEDEHTFAFRRYFAEGAGACADCAEEAYSRAEGSRGGGCGDCGAVPCCGGRRLRGNGELRMGIGRC